MREQVPVLLERLNTSLVPWLAQFGIKVSLDVASIKTFVVKYLNANFDELFGSVMSSLKLGGSVALAIIGNAVLIPVALFFLLMDWHRFVAHLLEFVPPHQRAGVDSFADEADAVLGQYLRGQLLVMGVLAVYYSAGAGAVWPGSGVAGRRVHRPGHFCALPRLWFGPDSGHAGGFSGVCRHGGACQSTDHGGGRLWSRANWSIESLFLTPRLVGERIGLHPLAVIFALLAFGQLFGFLGVLIALPASAVLLVGIRRVRDISRLTLLPRFQQTVSGLGRQMMKQIALDIGLASPPSFANFLAGPNEAVLKHLELWAGNSLRSPVPTYLWGEAAAARPICSRRSLRCCTSRALRWAGWMLPCWSRPRSTSPGRR